MVFLSRRPADAADKDLLSVKSRVRSSTRPDFSTENRSITALMAGRNNVASRNVPRVKNRFVKLIPSRRMFVGRIGRCRPFLILFKSQFNPLPQPCRQEPAFKRIVAKEIMLRGKESS